MDLVNCDKRCKTSPPGPNFLVTKHFSLASLERPCRAILRRRWFAGSVPRGIQDLEETSGLILYSRGLIASIGSQKK